MCQQLFSVRLTFLVVFQHSHWSSSVDSAQYLKRPLLRCMPATTKGIGIVQATTKAWLEFQKAATKARLEKLNFQFDSQHCWRGNRSLHQCPAKNAAWEQARAKRRNQLQHAILGNQYCQHCSNFLGSWTFYNLPRKFRSIPVQLHNGMLVHHSYICRHHTCIWYYRRGVRKYECIQTKQRHSLNQQLVAAGATNGLPGDRGSLLFKHFCRYQKNIPEVETSGHESRRAAGGRKHQCLRSTDARHRRWNKYTSERREYRSEYRKWKSQFLGWNHFTLASIPCPPKKVQVSKHSQQRSYPQHVLTGTSHTRARFFKNYFLRDRLDEPKARMDKFATPHRQLHLYTWNVETLLGVGKYEQLQAILVTQPIGIFCLQETKSIQTDQIKLSHFHFFLSGQSEDPHAGVGFAVPKPLIPLVHDFHPWSSRVAVLILNTRPLPLAVFSIYAPSKVQDLHIDQARKQKFWGSLQNIFDQYCSRHVPILLGDFNTRLYTNQTLGLNNHIGPYTFAATLEDEQMEGNNLQYFLEFLTDNNLCLPSTMRPRPPHKIITYAEITAEVADRLAPTTSTFATLDHIVARIEDKTMFHAISSKTEVHLPWFHRHFLLHAALQFPKFIPKRKKQHPAPRDYSSPAGVLGFQQAMLAKYSVSPCLFEGQHARIYTDGSCPNQFMVSVSNPAGWGVYFEFLDLDFYGPVGALPFPVVGSNNTGELQAPLEAICYLLTQTPIPPHVVFYMDSMYVLDLLSGQAVPAQNLKLCALLLDYFYHLISLTNVSLQKVKAHTGDPGNERADQNAEKGVRSRTNLGRFAQFPCTPPPPLPVSPALERFKGLDTTAQSSELIAAVLTAAEDSFPTLPPDQRKPYLSASTLQLVKKAQLTSNADALKTLHQKIRRSSRLDKKRWTQARLEEDNLGGPAQKWKTIRRVRTKYQPRTQTVHWPDGRPSTSTQKAEVLAHHLKSTVWKAQDLPPPNLAPILQPNPEMFAPFQMWELLQATRRVKSRKAPGPDAIPGECWRFLPHPVKQLLLKHFNDCFLGGSAPQHWKLAKVIMLFKGGTKNSRSPSSYRPISLVNTIYRLYATLLHQRLSSALEPHLSPQQFGFRRNRSMGSPLFIIRRLIEIFERHTTSLFVLFLDWSQAFDCVSHPQLRAALHRYGVPEPFVNAIMSIHQGSNFYVQDGPNRSSTYGQHRGIRQGCPLSPYLFIIVLSALMHDFHQQFELIFQNKPWTFSAEFPLVDVEYADDTVLMARTQSTLHQLLHLLQHLASQRGLLINPDKCQLLRLNSNLPIHLSRSTSPSVYCSCCFCCDFTHLTRTDNSLADSLPVVDTAKYLGAMISANGSSNADAAYRYSQAASAFRCLFPVFTHPQMHPKRKLQIYAQIVMAILLHGSESQVYTPAQITKLNSLHYKVLRQILQIKSSYYHRVLVPSDEDCSNQFLLQQAFAQVPGLLLPSQLISKNRIKYLGHILRHPSCIEHRICFNNSRSLRTISSPFRRGAPRAHWPEIALAESQYRLQCYRDNNLPSPGENLHPFFEHFTLQELKIWNHPSMTQWYDTTRQMHQLLPIAEQRDVWKQILN